MTGSGRGQPTSTKDGRLVGKVALITGGSKGIGEAAVRLFAAEGARVVFCGRNAANGSALERELQEGGADVVFVAGDITEEETVKALVDGVIRRFGRLDILMNNAGITATGTIEATDADTWRRLLEGNVTSMFLVCKHAIPALRAAGGGSIINLGSTYGVVGVPGSGAYAVTKAAAISLTRTLALELARDNIRVNALCPGATATPMNIEWAESTGDPEAALGSLIARHPIGRLSSPEEQAMAALFLASDESSYMTGHAMLVDGGFTASSLRLP
jgi:NAD(P)-dependent dehydrogenase (short-subunit alcohol dehydrogenase family)